MSRTSKVKCLEDWEIKKKAVTRILGEGKTSEFGRGLTYCIGLFLCHDEREFDNPNEKVDNTRTWFNGASDHLYELDISIIKDEVLKTEIENWKGNVLKWGHGFYTTPPSKKDKDWAIKMAKLILRYIDETMLNVCTIKGDYE